MRKYIIDDVEFYSHFREDKTSKWKVALVIIIAVVALALATHYDYLIITN